MIGVELPRNIDVMHSCDVRHCVSLAHLSHGTRKANMQDAAKKNRIAHSERRSRKLTVSQVLEIRALCEAGHPQKAVGEKFGIHQVTVSKIMTGKHWTRV